MYYIIVSDKKQALFYTFETFGFPTFPKSMSLRASAHTGVAIRIPRRQKKLAAFRFRGLRKSRENCISAPSFFLSKSKHRL